MVGHSNAEGIRMASDEWFEWGALGRWLARLSHSRAEKWRRSCEVRNARLS
jgi:hypothetical protein